MRTKFSCLFWVLVGASVSCTKIEQASPNAPLFDNLGTHHRVVTTSSELAQKYFDQGLRLVYAFNHDEAERAFREAARLDPKLAMAWWGVAYTLGPNYNLAMATSKNAAALGAVQKAQAVQSEASEAERDYIAAIATRYSADASASRADLDRAYSDAMKALHQKYPDDSDAAVLYAESLMDLKPWQLWTSEGKPQEGTTEILTVLEGVLSREPGHPGANHYYIHAIEASPNPEKGVASAERLATLVPGAGHLVHMPAHIFIRTGNYPDTVKANMNAIVADDEYFERTKVEGIYPLMYYTHNYQFLSAAAGMIGQSEQAIKAAQRATANAAPMVGHDAMADYALPWTLYALARNARFDDILAYPEPPSASPSTVAMWRYARTLALIGKKDVTGARQEREEFLSAITRVPMDTMLNTNKAHDLLSIAGQVLEARLSAATGDRKRAIGHWKQGIEIQDRLIYDEPPAWYYPLRESLGGEYLRDKQLAEAEKIFRRDLAINPNNPRSLFGLSEALRGQNKDSEANRIRENFQKQWQGTDVEVSVSTL